uniref:CSON007401 protein n=1 Tax=Culicoides sonorensis TaxID=179676 RepID=A0A336LND2_CULSO
MMWARTQFLGCAGALMYDGFLVTCYYHPKGNVIGKPIFLRGDSNNDVCSKCSVLRPSCSRTLTGLCGLDDEYILQSKAESIGCDSITIIILTIYFPFLKYLLM